MRAEEGSQPGAPGREGLDAEARDETLTARRTGRRLSELRRQWAAALAMLGANVGYWSLAGVEQANQWLLRMLSWNAYALTYLGLTLALFLQATPATVVAMAQPPPPGRSRLRRLLNAPSGVRTIVFIVGTLALLAAVFVLPRAAQLLPGAPWLLAGASVLAVVLSWLIVHVAFAQHYATLYYRSPGEAPLRFPGGEPPDYWDFAYFAFGVGSTFGTTDVVVTARRVRRVVLAHSVFSFAFNTVVLALTFSFLVS